MRIQIKFINLLINKTKKRPNTRLKMNLIKQSIGVDSLLKIKKNPPIIDRLVYKYKNIYSMFDLKKHTILGKMIGYKTCNDFYEYFKPKTSFFIARLRAYIPEKKVGTQFINIAKAESKRLSCNGRVTLSSYNAHKPPHIFYRKLGFNSLEKSKINIIDECIKENIPLYRIYKNWTLKMYLPEHTKKAPK